MTRRDRMRMLRAAVLVAWLLAFAAAYAWFEQANLPIRHLPRYFRDLVHGYGWWGPLVILGFYVIRTFFFLPSTPVILISGSLYGPVWGLLLTVLGDNLSAALAFYTGRFLGRDFVSEHEAGWFKRYDEILTRESFLSVLLMRLLFFPFDLVNFASGMSAMSYRAYAFATFLGIMPAIVTLVFLGDAFVNPRAYLVFAMLFALTVGSGLLLRQSKWVKKRLYRQE